MLFNKHIIRSFIDLPNHTSLIINCIGCNLHCYKCFNYEKLVANSVDTCNKTYILNQIKLNGYLSDAIILSGGEFLLNPIEEIIDFLKELKQIYDGLIIINTNGTMPEKMKLVRKYIDGFHTDMKLPYHVLNEDDREIISLTLGRIIDTKKCIESIKYTIKSDSGYSQIRSVKYPFIDLSVYEDNIKYILDLNNQYEKQTPYFINDFINF
jgi:pyruvate-formate lyase-activating enzyme